MAIPRDKDELLDSINSGFGRLFADLVLVDPAKADACTMEGHARGTLMSVSNLVAYLIGWNELVLKWLERDAAGEPVDFPETDFKWNELGRLARERIVSAVEAKENAELYGRPWYGKWTMGRMIQFNTSSPYANARGRLRKWRGTGRKADA